MIKWRGQSIEYTWSKGVSADNGVLAGVGWMAVGSTFIVAGNGSGIGSMIVGSTFIVGGNQTTGIGVVTIGDTFIVG